jgi:hypothetical protein
MLTSTSTDQRINAESLINFWISFMLRLFLEAKCKY